MDRSELLAAMTQHMEESLRRLLATTATERLSGCTCTLVYLHDNTLTVSNLGDTQWGLWRSLIQSAATGGGECEGADGVTRRGERAGAHRGSRGVGDGATRDGAAAIGVGGVACGGGDSGRDGG